MNLAVSRITWVMMCQLEIILMTVIDVLDIALAQLRSTKGWGEAQKGSNGLK